MNESQLHIGDTILYRGAFGLGPQQDAVITGFDEKNFRRLAGLNDGHWCYLNQIDSVVRSDWINVDDIIDAFPGLMMIPGSRESGRPARFSNSAATSLATPTKETRPETSMDPT